MDVREKLVELFYDNNVRCDQKIEGLVDDVMDIISNVATEQEWVSVDDMLPEEECRCLVIDEAGDIEMDLYNGNGETKTRLHKIWESMITRCEYEKHPYYADYGGRGITVCDEWHNYIEFRDCSGI